MPLIHATHNLRQPAEAQAKPFGIRVSLRATDPFRKILGSDWHRSHWYATAAERETALAEMSRRHDYSRPHDAPTLEFTRVENVIASRGR
jgi:hypothetical protein